MKTPLVSVVIPTHNRLKMLRDALDSVLNQSYSNLEVVLVDDCSNQETKVGIEEMARHDSRVRIIRNEENIGFVRSLNKGIREASGEYIARIDDDDAWIDKEKIWKQVKFFEGHSEYSVVGGGIIRVDEEGKEISRELLPETDGEIRNLMLITDPIVHVVAVFRKKDWEAVGGYDEKFIYSQDWELWMKLGKMGKYYNFQEYFVRYLQSSQNRSNKNMRHHLWLSLVARENHKNEFPNFRKGYIIGWISYLFSFISIGYRVHPVFIKIKKLFLK
ncbi:MAG: Glycosyltransferase [Candidatus Daviesbacteria bacterium GW2011_GWA2_38_24]|uniref:Glycosyltransferase n=1 Tax=Candidatus Daviesbacteria bacterium GW2011_GWA2_38_24 TaxID=1618422 RepID=A0A0G0JFC5_9BACT|nr:MAG: Glycosyltransferase [Candidatus Daviesbacteria bacterium GW2011_GWA2_38_24]